MSDSFTWRRFCRIPFDGTVPHPTTLIKLTTRCGSTAVDGLNRVLLAKAVEAKVVRTNWVRADTTVVPANVAYPTDSGLLAKAVRRIGGSVKRIHAAGGAVRTRVRDQSRSARAKAHGVAAKLRSRAKATALARTRDRDAAAGRRRGRLVRAVNDLQNLVEATERIIEQTQTRLTGRTPDGASRQVNRIGCGDGGRAGSCSEICQGEPEERAADAAWSSTGPEFRGPGPVDGAWTPSCHSPAGFGRSRSGRLPATVGSG